MSRRRNGIRNVIAGIALMLSLVLLAACGGVGDVGGVGGGGRITGSIENTDGDPILTEVTVSAGGRSVTTSTGAYSLSNVPTGSTMLKATAAGYEEYNEPINVTSGEIIHNITLVELPTDITGVVTAPPTNTASVPLSVWQKAVVWLKGPQVHAALSGESPLTNAKVQAYDWITGEPVGSEATTDASGNFTITGIPVGVSVLIEATKGAVRLSSIVPEVDMDHMAEVDTATTLAAEVLGDAFRSEARVDETVLDMILAEVYALVDRVGIQTIDLRAGEGWIGSEFGSSNLHQDLFAIREDNVEPLGDLPYARRLVSTIRNLGPSLIAYGGPVVEDATSTVNEKVGPILAGAVDYVATIGALLENADLDPLEKGRTFTFEAEEHVLDVEILAVTKIEEGHHEIDTAFTIAEESSEPFISGEMTFRIEEGRPVTWMRLDAGFYETVEGKDLQLVLNADIEYEWAEDLIGDEGELGFLRDLKRITIGANGNGEMETPLMKATGTMVADLSERPVDDSLYIVASAIEFNGELEVEDITMSGELEYALVGGTHDEYEMTAELTIESRTFDDFLIDGLFSAQGIALVKAETEDDFDESTSSFSGVVQVPGRPAMNLAFDATRNELYGVTLDSVTFERGDLVLTGTASVLGTASEDADFIIDGGTLDLNLADDEGYTISLVVTVDRDGDLDVVGSIGSPAGPVLATIEPHGTQGAVVHYYYSDKIVTESLF